MIIKLFLILYASVHLTLQADRCAHSCLKVSNYLKLETRLTQHFKRTVNLRLNDTISLKRQQTKFHQISRDIKSRPEYLGNLLNLFSLSQRLTKDWPIVLSLMKSHPEILMKLELPTVLKKLSQSSLTAFVRLQEVYNISTETLVIGDLDGTSPHAKLTASDFFDIGVYYYNIQHYQRSAEWFQAALQKSEVDKSIPRQRAMEYLPLAHCFKGDARNFNHTLQILQKEIPAFKPSEDLAINYTTASNLDCKNTAENYNLTKLDDDDAVHYVKESHMCRKFNTYIPPADKELRCRLLHYGLNHLRIGPYKMEEINLDPPLLLFHSVIHDSEINILQLDFHNKTKEATDPINHPLRDTQYHAWLEPTDPKHQVARRISKRTASITNMDVRKAEPCMLASYGLGGEIKPHFDLADEGSNYNPDTKGYVQADYVTVVYYLSDVQMGGLTIFPLIDRAVVPKKGNALMFFNRRPDWEPLMILLHSGCPVLRGSKWILTKWLSLLQQDYPKCLPGKRDTWKHYYL